MGNINALKAIGYTTDQPTVSGWYHVIFEPHDMPRRVYLHCSEHGISWGSDKEDDSEMVSGDNVRYKKAT